jgi:hypothetical protein
VHEFVVRLGVLPFDRSSRFVVLADVAQKLATEVVS